MRTYLVSGAGSGIGRAIARALAAQSAENHVLLLGRREQSLRETCSLLARPEQHLPVVADIRDPASIARALASVGLEKRSLSGVIANAGVGGENHYGPGDRWDEIIATNLTGAYRLVSEALPALRKSDGFKHIVLISSILGRIGVPGYTAYCASKAGLLGLMRSWAVELAREKILVNTICPGWVETDMAESGIRAIAEKSGRSYEQTLAEQVQMVPLRKMSKPDEIAATVRFLVSGDQCSITGQALDVNGGAWMA